MANIVETACMQESTLGASIISKSQRQGAAGALLYDIEYDLDSTRGRKRILNTVTIFDSKLYILNGQYKCAKEAEGGCSTAQAEQTLAAMRSVAASFDVSK